MGESGLLVVRLGEPPRCGHQGTLRWASHQVALSETGSGYITYSPPYHRPPTLPLPPCLALALVALSGLCRRLFVVIFKLGISWIIDNNGIVNMATLPGQRKGLMHIGNEYCRQFYLYDK